MVMMNPHYFPYLLGILMGIVWEAYHQGGPFLGAPKNPTGILGKEKGYD